MVARIGGKRSKDGEKEQSRERGKGAKEEGKRVEEGGKADRMKGHIISAIIAKWEGRGKKCLRKWGRAEGCKKIRSRSGKRANEEINHSV